MKIETIPIELSPPTIVVSAEVLLNNLTRNLTECAVLSAEFGAEVHRVIVSDPGGLADRYVVVDTGDRETGPNGAAGLVRLYRRHVWIELQRQARCHEESVRLNAELEADLATGALRAEHYRECLKHMHSAQPNYCAKLGEKVLQAVIHDCVYNPELAPAKLLAYLTKKNLL